MDRNSASGGQDYTLKLILAWAFVGVPLLWGVWNTLMNALLLFK